VAEEQEQPSNKDPAEAWEEHLAKIKIFDRERVTGQYCAFVDVLGFGNATQGNFGQVLSLYEELVERAEWVQASRHPVRVSVFSDSFVLVSSELLPLIGTVWALQFHMLHENWLVRGGISFGDHAEGEKAGTRFVVSTALTKAVAIEKSIKWPCVAIDPNMEIQDDAWLGRRILLFDGLRIVNPFSIVWYRTAGARVRRMKEEHPEHSAKYDWFLRLFDSVVTDQLVPPDVLERLKAKYPDMS
jgi:hypothetical protein